MLQPSPKEWGSAQGLMATWEQSKTKRSFVVESMGFLHQGPHEEEPLETSRWPLNTPKSGQEHMWQAWDYSPIPTPPKQLPI